jgi:hypothetical protein
MKTAILVIVSLVIASAGQAQAKKTNSVTAPPAPAIAKEAIFSSMESTLADGKIRFTRKLTATSATTAKTTYYLRKKNPGTATFSSEYEVQLDQDSFSSYFKKISESEKLPLLIKFVQEKKMSFSDEQAWAKAIAYYNSLD